MLSVEGLRIRILKGESELTYDFETPDALAAALKSWSDAASRTRPDAEVERVLASGNPAR